MGAGVPGLVRALSIFYGMLLRSCECTEGTGLTGCSAPAKWLARAGRQIGQLACARHLARVCDALSRDQGERVVLSLIPVVPEPPGASSP